MKNDKYTKTILTIIAVALIVIAIQNSKLVPTVNASASTGLLNSGTIDVNIVSINGRSIYGSGLDVRVVNTPEVKIKSSYGGLDVNVTNSGDFN